MTDRYQAILLFGAPGAGKGTQGEILGQVPGFFHLSTGDMFRSMDRHSDVGKMFYEYSSRGELVPDKVTIEIWHQYAHAMTTLGLFHPHSEVLVLDGIPRTIVQTKLIQEYVDVRGIAHLVAPDPEVMISRLQKRAIEQKRVDDAKIEVVRNRLEIYERETRPVLDQFDSSLIHEINAIGTPADVLAELLRAVAPLQISVDTPVTS